MKLTKRDYEILRTLVRVQLATTASLQRAFFGDLRMARRRLLTLRSVYGLITPHTKGLPGNYAICGGRYWRLTEDGLKAFAEHFPRERIPHNHIRRGQNASLRYFEHRDDMTSLYLRLIESQDRDIDELSARANIVDWRGEWEAVLRYPIVEGVTRKERSLVPDATLSTPHARYFVEVDRSTESRMRCRRTLGAYKTALGERSYAEQFPDALPVVVVYVTKSLTRAKGLKEVIASSGPLPYRALAMPMQKAVDWLSTAVTEAPGALPVLDPAEARRCAALRRLYDECCAELTQRKERSDRPSFRAAVMEAYECLQLLTEAS